MNMLAKLFVSGLTALSLSITLGQELLPAEKAFRVESKQLSANMVEFTYNIAPGYILYKDRFSVEIDDQAVKSESLELPKPLTKFDKAQEQNIDFYRDRVTVRVRLQPGKERTSRIVASAQGCATEIGVCYPPVRKTLTLDAGGDVESHMVNATPVNKKCIHGSTWASTDTKNKGATTC